jgi:hypothetical protein
LIAIYCFLLTRTASGGADRPCLAAAVDCADSCCPIDATALSTSALLMVVSLRRDRRFNEGMLHRLHADVGNNLTDFRSTRGAFGQGSLQIVVDLTTGTFYADVDLFNPYQDVVNWVGHAGEVVAGWFRRTPHGDQT